MHCAHFPNISLAFEHLPMFCIHWSGDKLGDERKTINQKQKHPKTKSNETKMKTSKIAPEPWTLFIVHSQNVFWFIVRLVSNVDIHLHPFLFCLLFSRSISWISAHKTRTITKVFLAYFLYRFHLLVLTLDSISFSFLISFNRNCQPQWQHRIQINVIVIIRNHESKND